MSLLRRAGATCGAAVALATWCLQAPAAGAVAACAAPQSGMAAVAVVVDTGAGDPVVRCTTVREGASGRDALVAAGVPFRVGSGTPADNNQGGAFLCGIQGVPQTGCAAPSSKGYSYWAYYRQPAGSPWTYARVGFFTPVGSRCWVEGWRYTSTGGVAAADNPRPRVDPPAVPCSAAPAATGAAPAAASSGAPTSTVTTVSASPAPQATNPPGPSARPAGATASGPSAAAATATAPTTAAPDLPTTSPAAEVAGRTTVVPPTTAPPGTERSGSRRGGPVEQAAGSPQRPGGGVPWVAVGALAVAALIGLGAVLRGRRAA